MNLPKAMLTRKLIINLLQNKSEDYTHEWLPNCSIFNYIPTEEKNISREINYKNDCY